MIWPCGENEMVFDESEVCPECGHVGVEVSQWRNHSELLWEVLYCCDGCGKMSFPDVVSS